MPQPVRLANDQLRTCLEKEGYYETKTTPGLWRYKWRPILFSLIANDFGVKYVGKYHADKLDLMLWKYHIITINWEGKKLTDIHLEVNYTNHTCRLTTENYIRDALTKYGHPMTSSTQLSPHKHRKINYGDKT